MFTSPTNYNRALFAVVAAAVAACCVFAFAPQVLTVSAPAAGGLDGNFNAPVYTLSNLVVDATAVQADGKVLIGGTFSLSGDTAHNGVVRLNADGQIDPTFNGGTGAGGQSSIEIHAIAVQSDGKILVGGYFGQFNGQNRPYLARLNSDGSLDASFNIGTGPTNRVRSVAVMPDGRILIAGDFGAVNGIPRNRVARLNADGSVDGTFNPTPAPNNSVYTINVQSDGKVLIGGIFGSVSGSGPSNFVRLNADGTYDSTFNIGTGVGFRVWTIAVAPDDKIAIGGFFSSFNGVARNNVALLNPDGSLIPNFNPNITNEVLSLAFQSDGKLLAGGNYNQVNGTTRNSICRLNTDGSLDTAYNVGVSFKVNSVSVGPDQKAVIGGDFSSANGVDRSAVARFEVNGQIDAAFDPVIGSPGWVNASYIAPDGRILLGGFFNSVGGRRFSNVARLLADGSPDSSFQPGSGADGAVQTVAVQQDGRVLVGGSFSHFNGQTWNNIVRLNANGAVDPSFALTTGTSISVRVIKVQADNKILIGGGFVTVGSVTRDHVARLNADGSFDTTFTGQADGDVNDVAVQPDGKIIIVGSFRRVNNAPSIGIARLNPDGTTDASFNTGAGAGQIFSVDLQPDGKVLIGGFFTAYNNVAKNYIARLNPDGSLDKTFDAGNAADFTVFSVTHQPDGKIIVGGDFFTFGGGVHKGLVRLLNDGRVDTSFTPVIARAGFNKPTVLNAVVTQSATDPQRGSLLIGGRFTDIDGQGRIGLAKFGLRFNFGSAPFDFDGDGKTDISIFRPNGASGAEWWGIKSFNQASFAALFGTATDIAAPADYTGDGKTDIAFFRPSAGQWFVLRSEDFSFYGFPFGADGDVPTPADYDGDGKTDAAVFRSGSWYILRSSDSGVTSSSFGVAGDKPVPADYDGDGKADIGIFRPNGGTGGEWWIQRSTAGLLAATFGSAQDKTVVGDWTGDGKADCAFFRPSNGTWYVLRSEDLSFYGFPFGISNDVPAPGDYDGDGKTDAAVFRQPGSQWFVNKSSGGVTSLSFGAAGDLPVASAYVR